MGQIKKIRCAFIKYYIIPTINWYPLIGTKYKLLFYVKKNIYHEFNIIVIIILTYRVCFFHNTLLQYI